MYGQYSLAISVVGNRNRFNISMVREYLASNIGGTAVADQNPPHLFLRPTLPEIFIITVLYPQPAQTITSNPSGVVSVYATPVAGTISGNSYMHRNTRSVKCKCNWCRPLPYMDLIDTAVATVSNTGLVTRPYQRNDPDQLYRKEWK